MAAPDQDTILHVLSRCEVCQAGQVRWLKGGRAGDTDIFPALLLFARMYLVQQQQ